MVSVYIFIQELPDVRTCTMWGFLCAREVQLLKSILQKDNMYHRFPFLCVLNLGLDLMPASVSKSLPAVRVRVSQEDQNDCVRMMLLTRVIELGFGDEVQREDP